MPESTKALKLHAEARAELQLSVSFYRERGGEQWAARFKQQVVEGLKAISADPKRFPVIMNLTEVRRLRMKQFPFSLLYIERLDYIWIVAVAHGSRKPGYWKKRI